MGGRELTDDVIEAAKRRTRYTYPNDIVHEHPDCIRMAFEWLDAQRLVKSSADRSRPVKHLIEKWAGRYISTTDVDVAAELHPRIVGRYPRFNLSARLVLPNDRRLHGISEAFTHRYRDRIDRTAYAIEEV